MKKLLTIAVLATLSTMTYAADKVIDTDIVVVGQGAAGTAAAFAAGELGAKVVGLEKKGLPGGTGNFSEGIKMWMPASLCGHLVYRIHQRGCSYSQANLFL